MNRIEKIRELMMLCLLIQTGGFGENGYPFVEFCTSNYGNNVSIRISDRGFPKDSSEDYDGEYTFKFTDFSERKYQICKAHLQELIDAMEGE